MSTTMAEKMACRLFRVYLSTDEGCDQVQQTFLRQAKACLAHVRDVAAEWASARAANDQSMVNLYEAGMGPKIREYHLMQEAARLAWALHDAPDSLPFPPDWPGNLMTARQADAEAREIVGEDHQETNDRESANEREGIVGK